MGRRKCQYKPPTDLTMALTPPGVKNPCDREFLVRDTTATALSPHNTTASPSAVPTRSAIFAEIGFTCSYQCMQDARRPTKQLYQPNSSLTFYTHKQRNVRQKFCRTRIKPQLFNPSVKWVASMAATGFWSHVVSVPFNWPFIQSNEPYTQYSTRVQQHT